MKCPLCGRAPMVLRCCLHVIGVVGCLVGALGCILLLVAKFEGWW
jgi:hypothetical protein